MAWRQGDMNHFERPPQNHHYGPSSPSVTSTSSDDREEVPMVRHPPRRPHSRNRHHHHHHHQHHQHGGGFHYPVPSVDHFPGMHNGTLRSTRSVPALALATWDGEPCPVHGQGSHQHSPHQHGPPLHFGGGMPGTMRRYGSMFDMRATPVFPPPPPSVLEKKSLHGSMQMLPTGPPFGPPMGPPTFPPHFYPPMMRMPGPRQVVIPAGVEPLPMRDPYKSRHQPPPRLVAKMEEDPYSMDQVCCKGHLIVLWIILGVVTVGVILGIILGVTIA